MEFPPVLLALLKASPTEQTETLDKYSLPALGRSLDSHGAACFPVSLLCRAPSIWFTSPRSGQVGEDIVPSSLPLDRSHLRSQMLKTSS